MLYCTEGKMLRLYLDLSCWQVVRSWELQPLDYSLMAGHLWTDETLCNIMAWFDWKQPHMCGGLEKNRQNVTGLNSIKQPRNKPGFGRNSVLPWLSACKDQVVLLKMASLVLPAKFDFLTWCIFMLWSSCLQLRLENTGTWQQLWSDKWKCLFLPFGGYQILKC